MVCYNSFSSKSAKPEWGERMEKSCQYEKIRPNLASGLHLRFSIDTGSVFGRHFHDWIEIIYLVRGSLEVEENHISRTLFENDFVVINPMSVHATRCTRGNTAILLQIPLETLKRVMPDVEDCRFRIDYASGERETVEKLDRIRDIMKELWIEQLQKEEGYELKCYSLVFELAYILVSSFSYRMVKKDRIRSERNMERLQWMIRYIGEHYREELSLGRIAKEAGLSPGYFSRFFREQMGISYLEYLQEVRMEHIYRDLKDTDLPIGDLLERHGFYNYKLFLKLFKKHYGCLPKDCRKEEM